MTAPAASDALGKCWCADQSPGLGLVRHVRRVFPGRPAQHEWIAGAVNVILSGVCQLLSTEPSFCCSLAKAAYLQAYLAANPDDLATLASVESDRFALMGGGVTSPDHPVCHGEVFIGNYLVGRRWLASVGLQDHVARAAVVLAAMGLGWLGLSRVPGSPQPFGNQPLDGGPVADQLSAEGLVVPWTASDGSQVLAPYMPYTYGAVWDCSKGSRPLQFFVEEYNTGWPTVTGAPLLFAPAGGDFVFSQWNAGTRVQLADRRCGLQPEQEGRRSGRHVRGFPAVHDRGRRMPLARASQCAHLPRTNYAHPPGTNQLAAPVSQRAVPPADRARSTDGPVPFGAPPTVPRKSLGQANPVGHRLHPQDTRRPRQRHEALTSAAPPKLGCPAAIDRLT